MSDEMILADVLDRAAKAAYERNGFAYPERECDEDIREDWRKIVDAVLAVLAEAGCLRTPGTVEVDSSWLEGLRDRASYCPDWAAEKHTPGLDIWRYPPSAVLRAGDTDPLP